MGLYGSYDRHSDLRGLGAFGLGDQATLEELVKSTNYPNYPDRIMPQQGLSLKWKPSITSKNGLFNYGIGSDGNTWIVDNISGKVLRNFNTEGSTGTWMGVDGNYGVYGNNKTYFNTGTVNHPGAYLVLQDDGNLVLIYNNSAVWNSGTEQPSSLTTMEATEELVKSTNYPNYPDRIMPQQGLSLKWKPSITSKNGLFNYGIGSDGNTWIVDNISGKVLRNFNTEGSTGTWMGVDGNYGVYGNNKTYFSTGTVNHPGAYLVLQDDGNLVLIYNNSAVWNSGTEQSISYIAEDTKTQQFNIANPLGSGSRIEGLINQLMIQKDHNGTIKAQYWKSPQFLNATGDGWLSPQDTKTKIYASIDAYVAKINSSDLSSLTIADKKSILYYLMYPYFYFANQTINLSPYRQTGHSGHQVWTAAQWSSDYTYDILGKIIPVVQKLGFTGMYSYLTGLVVTFWGASYGATNTGGKYPTEIGFRKLIDETYRSQSDAAAKNSSVIGQVGEFFNQLGTEAWHGLVMPAIGFAALGIMLTGFQGVTFIVEIFDPNLHLNALIYGWIGHMFQGLPFLGQFINRLLQWYGKFLDHVALQITNIFSPNVDPNKARDEEEYKILTSSTDNELINFEKNVQAITKILNDWDSDKRDDLKAGLITNINNRANAKVIWASLNVIDSKLLGVS